MARVVLCPKRRFEFGQRLYEIKEKLLDGKILAQDLSYGGTKNFATDEIAQYVYEGLLRFEIKGKNTKDSTRLRYVREPKWADLSQIDERYRDIALERYLIIKPLVFKSRQLKDIKDRIKDILIGNIDLENKELKITYIGEKISVATIYRWIKCYEDSNGDIRSLIPSNDECGAKGFSRLPEEVDKIIAAAIDSHYLRIQRKSIRAVHEEVEFQVIRLNQFRDEKDRLKVPSYGTIRNKINKLDPRLVSNSRLGKRLTDLKYEPVYSGAETGITRPLEVVYIDHTHLDLFVVDEDDRLPIGRPYLTFIIDMATRYPLGFYIGFTPPSYSNVMECMYHSIVPKTYLKEKYPQIEEEWRAYGLFETLYVDNGKEFRSRSLEDACMQLGINLQYARPKMGQDKPYIERFFGTLNTQLLHELPGTSFSNIMSRKDYDPLKNAVISLQAFEEILHHFLICMYSERPRTVLGGVTPAQAWSEGCRDFCPELPYSNEELWPLIGQVEYGQIQKTGIQFKEIHYNSAELAKVRCQLDNVKQKVLYKFHPKDLSNIFVWDSKKQNHIKVYATNQEYTKNLSLWKHNLIRKSLKKKTDEINMIKLMEERKYIEQIVEREWVRTKRTSTRKVLARFKGIEGSIYSVLRTGQIPVCSNETPSQVNSAIQTDNIKVISCETKDVGVKEILSVDLVQKDIKSQNQVKPVKSKVFSAHEDISDNSNNLDLNGWG